LAAMEWKHTACNLCYINCGLEVLVEDGRITKVRGDKANPKSQGYLCNKAARIPFYAHHKDRLTSPLRRRADGGFDAISWDDAIGEIAARAGAILKAHGGQAFARYGGGGQGNHAGGPYSGAFLAALGSNIKFNALSQEKTGDFWLNGLMFGSQQCHTAEDVHHCDLLFVIGANPWLAHGFPNAREHLNEIKNDPARKLIVIDPRRSETAQMANLHLAVRPGADAFLLGAILARLVERDNIDHDFLTRHTTGYEDVRKALVQIPVGEWAAAAGVPLTQIDQCIDMIAAAKAMAVRVELGIQQGLNSTLNSYLEKLLIMLTGSFGRKGTNQLHSWLVPLWGNSPGKVFEPTGDEIIAGLLPPTSLAKAILADHPNRLRALFVDSANPANTVSDTQELERSFAALDLMVVVDVALTETARLAHYVLPAASQYEKTEFTLFNLEAPTNFIHVRPAALTPLAGTLPEQEIYTRLARAVGVLPAEDALTPLREAATRSRREYAAAFAAFMAANPAAAPVAPFILYHTLGRALPNGTATAAVLWPAARACAKRMPEHVRRALGVEAGMSSDELGDYLFDRIVGSPQGIAFTVHSYDEVFSLVEHEDKKIRLAIPAMLDWLLALDPAAAREKDGYPFVLAAGQRRMFNANQIFRDPAWRRSDLDGSLLVNPADLAALDCADGDWVAVVSERGRLVVRAKADDTMSTGLCALPHGYGQAYPATGGERLTNGPRVNELTSSSHRAPIAGTPYHKHVAVRLERLTSEEAQRAEAMSHKIHALAS
jgi:anaerobic selenocysteine-containing dehydrogenase